MCPRYDARAPLRDRRPTSRPSTRTRGPRPYRRSSSGGTSPVSARSPESRRSPTPEGFRFVEVDVVGVSLGGVVAQQLARQAGRRVRRLVLAATGPGLGGVPGSPRVLWALATPRRYYQPDYYRRIAAHVYGGEARRDPDAMLHGSIASFVQRPSVVV